MGDTDIEITVKFSGRSIPIVVSPDATVQTLKTFLLPLTNVLARGQKLIFKGKILENEMALREAKVTNGAKLMLVGSQGLHQGDGPSLKEAKTQIISRNNDGVNDVKAIPVGKNSVERWQATGVVGLAERNLKAIPDEVWACAPYVRFLDISNNSIQHVSNKISSLTGLKKLFLNANGLSDDSINWERLACFEHLTVLSVSQNCLNALPSRLGCLTTLKHLDVSHNKLSMLPFELTLLSKLEVLKANNNRISSVPVNIGECTSLIEIDLSSNLLSQLPVGIVSLKNLQALRLSNNALKSLPPSLFIKCTQLSTLDLHNTEFTIDVLRELEGWEDFDKRRLAKHQKQLDFRMMGYTDFDEGADKS